MPERAVGSLYIQAGSIGQMNRGAYIRCAVAKRDGNVRCLLREMRLLPTVKRFSIGADKTKWDVLRLPSPGWAQIAQMATEAFDFYFRV